ncbi:MAG: hypothetical protein K0S47_4538 [Herbinix sp.]|jgi:ribosomal protein S18 acetylase RimI-like enzyme|nr:hypothetical protein [Herbinix sp.]
MEIRKATLSDLDSIVANRMEFIHSIHEDEFIIPENFAQDTYEYLKQHLVDDTISAWIAIEHDVIVSIVIVCFYDLLPLISNLNGKTGYVLNVYTLPNHRRKGLATKVLTKIINESQERGVGKLYLNATEEGMPVYKKLGFRLINNEMVYQVNNT